MSLNLKKWIGGLAVLGVCLVSVLATSAKDAPKPTAPPTVWLKYVHEKIKAPKPAPKENQTESRPKLPGVSSLSGALPSATPFPPKRPPYVHPRDLKDFTGDIHKQIQGPPPPR